MPGIPFALSVGAATSDRIDCGTGSSLAFTENTKMTALLWFQITTFTANRQLFAQNATDGNGGPRLLLDGTSELHFVVNRGPVGTANCDVTTNNAALVVGVPYVVAVTFDAAATQNGHVFLGSLTQPITELTYAGAANLSGNVTTTTAWVWFNRATIFNTAVQCLAWVGARYNAILDLAEMRAWQANPFRQVRPELALCQAFAANGTGRVIDRSGNNNHGTITGAIPTSNYLPGLVSPRRTSMDVGAILRTPWHYYAQMRGAA